MTADIFIEPLTEMPFTFIRGGRFLLGDGFGDGFPDERPVVEVAVGDFWLGIYPVTQRQWRRVMDGNPSMFKKSEDLPVEMVSWDAAKEFVRRLNERSTGGFRLPTEFEWEYAARSGGRAEKWAGTSSLEELGDYAWYEANANGRTHPVGLKKPNGLGLHDMSGNTHEWNEDYYFNDLLPVLAATGGRIPETATSAFRSFRGGSWKRHAEGLRCTRRMGGRPHLGFGTFGLRLARDADKAEKGGSDGKL